MKKSLCFLLPFFGASLALAAGAQDPVEENLQPTSSEPRHESYRKLRPSEVSDYHLFAELVRQAFAEFRRGDEVYEVYLRQLGLEPDSQAGRAFTRAILRSEALFLDSPPLSAQPVWSAAERMRAASHAQDLQGIYLDLLAGLREGRYPPSRLVEHLENQVRPAAVLWVRTEENSPQRMEDRTLLATFSQGAAEELGKRLPPPPPPTVQTAQVEVEGLPLGLGRKVWKVPREETPLYYLVCTFYSSWLHQLQTKERMRFSHYLDIGIQAGSDADKAFTKATLLANAALLDYATVDIESEGFTEWQVHKIEKETREIRSIYIQMLRELTEAGLPLEHWEQHLNEKIRRSTSITIIGETTDVGRRIDRAIEGFANGIMEALLEYDAPQKENS